MKAFNRHASSRDLLREQFELLQAKNPRFSLRAFARMLALSPSHLSKVLAGKKNFSPENAKAIATKLRMVDDQRKYFLLLVELEGASVGTRAMIRRKADATLARIHANRNSGAGKLAKLRLEHLLLLAAFSLRESVGEKELSVFGEYAGLSLVELKRVVADLVRAKLLAKAPQGYVRVKDRVLLHTEGANPLFAAMHGAYAERMKKLVAKRSPATRFSATEFYAIPLAQMPALRERAEEFLDEVASLSHEDDADGVVEVALHLNSFGVDEVFGG